MFEGNNFKNKKQMGEKMGCGTDNGKCPHCEKRAADMARAEEINLAVLIALVPVMTLTLFNGLGLF